MGHDECHGDSPGKGSRPIETLQEILGWCSLINMGLLLWWFLAFVFAHDRIYGLHGRWFRLSVEQFDAIHYGAMGIVKMMVLVFNLVPYLVLRMLA
ncbi:MAG: hypothetical protein DSY87_08145 [Methylococcus sp.]|nr:MAG: hypothetical protein DSY87_08145 [Methylococcus sp.]